MFGERVDLAILSAPLALQRAKRFGPVRLCRFGYAITGVCGLRVILFAVPRRFCPIAAIARWAFCFGPHELSGTMQVKAALHRGIGIAQSLTRLLELRLPPAFFPGTQG
ncbi:MAG: hypothetical protein GDA36_06025 [Rhodobacteraceae bacterium]|nr:hypothetical protein [Paracoccaceae bacterium]